MFNVIFTARLLQHQTLVALANIEGATVGQLAKIAAYAPKADATSEWERAKADAVAAMVARLNFPTLTNRLTGIDVMPDITCGEPPADPCAVAQLVASILPE